MPTRKQLETNRRRKEQRLAWCFACMVEKPWEEFDKSPSRRPFGLSSRCHKCEGERKKLLHKKARGKLTYEEKRKLDRRKNLSRFGLTVLQYEEMLRNQEGKCLICKQEETVIHHLTGKPSRLVVDHDHKTKQVRGLLCQKCNKAIGLLNDDPNLARNAAAYLENAP